MHKGEGGDRGERAVLNRLGDSTLLSVAELRVLDDKLTAAHLPDRLTGCGCSKQTLRVCTSCRGIACGCTPCVCRTYM